MSSASSPGKLILCGEHAILAGCPAIVLAVTPRVSCRVTPGAEMILNLPGLDAIPYPEESLKKLEEVLTARHQQGLPPSRPHDLLALAALRTAPDWRGTLSYETDLPIGSGMGASAAFLLSTLNALKEEWNMKNLYQQALSLEHLQHGTSSGLDLWASMLGGCWWVEGEAREEIEVLPLPEFQLFHTGTPSATTGECVEQVRSTYPLEHKIWDAFEEVALHTQEALLEGEGDQWNTAIRQNEDLLHTIGVVPEAVHSVLKRIESAGGAGKVCGAGSIRGDAGGVVLVRDTHPELIPPAWTAIPSVPQSTGTQ